MSRYATPEIQRGAEFLQAAFNKERINVRSGLSMTQLAKKAGCEFEEVRNAIEWGKGPVGGRPEPRVLWGICGALRASYPDAMEAFGFIVDKPKPPSLDDVPVLTPDELKGYRDRVTGATPFPGQVPAGMEKAKAAMDNWHLRMVATLERCGAFSGLMLPRTVDGLPLVPGMNVWTPGSAWCEEEIGKLTPFSGYPVVEVVATVLSRATGKIDWRVRFDGSGEELRWINNLYGRRESLPELQEPKR